MWTHRKQIFVDLDPPAQDETFSPSSTFFQNDQEQSASHDGEELLETIKRPDSSMEALEAIFARGVEPNHRNALGQTAMHVAAEYAFDADLLDYLIAKGCFPTASDHFGRRPLHIAMNRMEHEFASRAVQILKPYGVDFIEQHKLRPLHLAVGMLHFDAVSQILELRPDVNAQDSRGNTPLHFTSSRDTEDNARMVAMLVDAGANPKIENEQGQSAWRWAKKSRFLRNAMKQALARRRITPHGVSSR